MYYITKLLSYSTTMSEQLYSVLRIRSIFYGSVSADPVFKIRIRIRVTQKRPDPTGSGSGSDLDMFLMFSIINIFLWHFLTKSSYLMTLKTKDKKLFGRNFILDNDI